MTKTRVGVIRGGPGAEYDVSMHTGSDVLVAIDTHKFESFDIVITHTGEWLRDGFVRFPEQILADIDIVFIALHGTFGEDGSLQRLLDTFTIPYVGSGALASSIAINKPLTKDHLRDQGIRMAPHMIVTKEAFSNTVGIARMIAPLFGPEYVIKPLQEGSSVGVMMVENSEMLPIRIAEALDTYDEILVEKRICGREGSCGVIERFRNQERYVLPPIEIIPPKKAGFFAAEVKYTGETEEICPGRFSKAEKKEMEQITEKVHAILGLSQYSRSDFMLDNTDVYFIEVNTLPGLSSQSLFPKAVTAVGSNYSEFVNHLLTDALEHV